MYVVLRIRVQCQIFTLVILPSHALKKKVRIFFLSNTRTKKTLLYSTKEQSMKYLAGIAGRWGRISSSLSDSVSESDPAWKNLDIFTLWL